MQEEKSQNKSEKNPLFCQMCYEDQTKQFGKILTMNLGGYKLILKITMKMLDSLIM